MPHLEVDGAKLYHEVYGQGPMLLCVSGGDGSCEIWRGFAEALKEHFTVVLWDRRGFSRSHLKGAQDYAHRLEGDADDAVRLINEFSPDEPATVIGNSSGAIVALKLLTRDPDRIKTLLSYEPPTARLLPDFDDLWTQHEDIYATYRASGVAPAFLKFADITHQDRRMVEGMATAEMPFLFQNVMYWFEREFMVYPQADFDVEGEFGGLKGKLVLVCGEESPREAYQYRGNVRIGKVLGLEVVHFPGGHVGQATHAQGFADKLVEVLKEREGKV